MFPRRSTMLAAQAAQASAKLRVGRLT